MKAHGRKGHRHERDAKACGRGRGHGAGARVLAARQRDCSGRNLDRESDRNEIGRGIVWFVHRLTSFRACAARSIRHIRYAIQATSFSAETILRPGKRSNTLPNTKTAIDRSTS